MVRHRFAYLVLLALSGTALAACPGGGDDPPGDPTSTSSGTSAGGAGGAGGDGGAGGMPPACDDYTTLPQTECDLLAQDCKLASQACRPLADGSGTDCFASTGLKTAGTPCTNTGECQRGMFCVNAVCSPTCCLAREAEICGNAKCNLELSFDKVTDWMRVCNFAKVCHLFTPGSCPQGQECHLQDLAQEVALCSVPAGTQSDEGGPCTHINSCHDSQICEGNSDVCRYSCTIDGWQNKNAGEGGCPQGQTCHPAPPTTSFGICGP
jgi:hypothetical protein